MTEKLYRVQMNSNGMPNFSTAVEVDTDISEYSDKLWRNAYERGKADGPKHYCTECKYEPIDKRCMPCSSCTNNPKNRDAFVSCKVEKKGADDE